MITDLGPSQTLTFTLGTPTNAVLGAPATNTLTIAQPPLAPTTLVFLQQPSDSTVFQPTTPDVLVEVLDQRGNPFTTGVVTLSVGAGSAGDFESPSPVTVAVDASGVADFANLFLDAPGAYTLVASSGAASTTSAGFSVAVAALDLSLNPSQTTSGVPTVSVGDSFDLGGSFAGFGDDPYQAVISWGDGAVTSVPVTVVDQLQQFATSHIYSQEGSFLVGVAIEDEQGRIVAEGALPGPVQVVPDHFGTVEVVSGQPGQTVTQSVTDTATGITYIVTLTLGPGDPPGGYLLVTQLNKPVETSEGSINYVASFDIRQFRLPTDATAAITLLIPGQLPVGSVGQLQFLDRETDPANPTQQIFQGPTFFKDANVVFVVNQFTTPSITDLTGTVFTVAAVIPGQTTAAAVSASVASAAAGATAPLQTASFRTTTQLTLTLEPSQAGQISSTRSVLRGDAADGGGSEEPEDAAEMLLEFLLDEWNSLPKFLMPALSFGGDKSAAPASQSQGSPAPATGPMSFLPSAEPPQSFSALDLFLRDPTPQFDWFKSPAPTPELGQAIYSPRPERSDPSEPGQESTAFLAAAVGLGFVLSDEPGTLSAAIGYSTRKGRAMKNRNKEIKP